MTKRLRLWVNTGAVDWVLWGTRGSGIVRRIIWGVGLQIYFWFIIRSVLSLGPSVSRAVAVLIMKPLNNPRKCPGLSSEQPTPTVAKVTIETALKPFSLGSATPPVLWGSWTGRVSSEACTLRVLAGSTLGSQAWLSAWLGWIG